MQVINHFGIVLIFPWRPPTTNTNDANSTFFLFQILKCTFGSVKINSGAVALLEQFIWISVNAAIQTLVRTKPRSLEKVFDWNMIAVWTKNI